MTPSPADLSYFVEAAKCGNFSRAAAKLGISQPSLSAAMIRVEAAIGVRLFLRSRKGVELTRPGRQLLEQSQRLFNAWEEVRVAANETVKEVQGTYSIGVHPSVALYTLHHFLPGVLLENPKLEIKLRHDLSRRVTEDVIEGTVDLAIAVNPRPHPDLIITRLGYDLVTIWRSADKERDVSDEDPSNAILICDPDLLQTQAILKKMRVKERPIRIIESNNLEVICGLTATGLGVGILPTRVAQGAHVPLAKITRAPTYRDEICVVIRKDSRKIEAIRCLVAAIKTSFESRE